MSLNLVTEPIERWPLPETKPRESVRFKAKYSQTLQLLERELDHLNARGPVVLQVVTRNGATDIRRDGALRAQAKIEHPGVRLSFQSKHGPLTYATDTFEARYYGDMPSWQANLRAIALGLESLRTVDRYGISRRGEQYSGWRAIGAGTGLAPSGMTTELALEVISRESGLVLQDASDGVSLTRAVRAAMATAHPDRNAGKRDRFDAVDQARQVLQRGRYLP